MDRRRDILRTLDQHPIHGSGITRHGPYPGSVSATHHHVVVLSPPEPSRDILFRQLAEIEQLSVDRRTLSHGEVELRQEVDAAHHEIEKLRNEMNDTAMGSDAEIRVLLDKIAKMAVQIREYESVKNELQQAQTAVIQLLADKRELNARVKQAIGELEKAQVGLKILAEKHEELHNLRQESQRLHTNFEYERAVNLEKVEQMQAMEKTLLNMSQEVENLHAAISTAESSISEPSTYVVTNSQPQPFPWYQPPIHTTGVYMDEYGRPYTQVGVAAKADGTISYDSRYSEVAHGNIG